MDRRRAAGALLALAACIATSAAAPTANNHTALDLYDEPTEGCYYNFQHYGEGDRIMTNEPCLNCTCHNRMLMCYLRVCPFTKAIGQDCSVEKRADQCCPIVTCPDVPVDLLTSTSTSSPAEYGGTGVGKVDNYGCSINGKYFPEGAKVPPAPGKPCEHCYCIRNMTTCVMQECTLHVDGCTPIYHKDVCCPVRYFCDHPEDEIPLLDDMTTTVRPTPGFLLTTIAPTEAPETTTLPARRDCIEDNQLYPDGALIKTDKPCEHCYCMKGDIVCVVQECGTPMENEGKNCSSLPPREGQCCPDTYICEGDEQNTEMPSEEPMTTMVPPRRVSVEGSGYRNEPDEIPYTEIPTFATELEGSGEEEPMDIPQKETTENDLIDKFSPTGEAEFIPLTTQVPISEEIEKATTEPDKGLNTVPSGIEEEHTEHSLQEKTTVSDTLTSTEPTLRDEMTTIVDRSSESSLVRKTTPIYETRATEPLTVEEQTTVSSIVSEGGTPPAPEKEMPAKEEEKITESEAQSTTKPEEEAFTGTLNAEEPSATEATKVTDLPLVSEQDIAPGEEIQEPTEPSVTQMAPSDEEKSTILPLTEESDKIPFIDSRRTTPDIDFSTTPKAAEEEEKTDTSMSEHTTHQDKLDVTEPSISEQNTVPISVEEEQSSEAPQHEITTMSDESKISELPSTEQEAEPAKPIDDESSEPSVFEKTTRRSNTEVPVKPEDVPTNESTTVISKEEETVITTEPTFRKEEEVTTQVESVAEKEHEPSTMSSVDTKESEIPSDKATSTERISTSEPEIPEQKPTTVQPLEQQEKEAITLKEATTESIMELSTFAHVSNKESTTTLVPESETVPTVTATEKIDFSETTSINPADNEIAEVPSPGRIPGEGDCLLEGTTYMNESIVPSTNKCHSGCKCVSSIIKCDPILCSSPPEEMDNCQPRYDTPEACCPTYICDHGMETIPPQPQSHITGTESPTQSPIECHGDICEKVDDKQPSAEPPQTPDTMETSDCGSSGCDQAAQTPAESCTDGKCDLPQPPTVTEQSHETPTKEIPQSCANPEDCKEVKIPEPCEGESCTASQSDQCNKEGGCVVKPDAVPQQETPLECGSEEECKLIKIPQPESAPCEGDSCTNIQGDCSGDECKISPPLQPSQDGGICSEESGCKKPEGTAQCENGKCQHKEIIDRTGAECSGEDCMQQQPISPTQETSYLTPVSTEAPSSEDTTSRQTTVEEELEPASPELLSTLSEEAVTAGPSVPGKPDKEIIEPESPLPQEEEQVTKTPEEIVTSHAPEVTSEQPISEDKEQKTTEIPSKDGTTSEAPVTETPQEYTSTPIKTLETESPASFATESSPQTEDEIKPTEGKVEQPEEVTETQDVRTDKPEETVKEPPETSTEVPQQQYDDTKPTELSETHLTEENTKSPEIEQEHIPVSLEIETKKPEEESEEPVTETPGPEKVTVKVTEESTKLTEMSEETNEPGIKATEPSIQESQETEKPKISTISDEMETKTDAPTKLPTLQEEEITTTSYEEERPAAHVTEPQPQEVITEEPKEETEKTPEHPDAKDQFETTSRPSDITQTVSSFETELPETDGKDSATDTPAHPTKSDEIISPEQEVVQEPHVESQTTESPEKVEIVTPSQQADSEEPVNVDEKEKVTESPETSLVEDKGTEPPLSLVTSQPQGDITTISAISENEIPETTTPKSQLQEIEDEMKPQAPESSEPQETASPYDTDKTEAPQRPVTEQELFIEKISTEKPYQEPPASEQQEPKPEVPLSFETESPVSEEQEQPITRTPTISETERPVSEEQEQPITRTPTISETERPVSEEQEQPITRTPTISETERPVSEEQEQPITRTPTISETERPVSEEQEQPITRTPTISETERPVSEEQEQPITRTPTISETERPVSEEQEQPITRTPTISETETPVFDEQVPVISQETETPELQDETTKAPEKEVEKVTESHEPVITEEYEISTEEPEKSEQEEQHVTIPAVAPMEPHDSVTKEPESHVTEIYKSTERSEEAEKTTEKPVSVIEIDVTKPPETIASIQSELPISVTESIETPEQVPDGKVTTVSPISEHEITQTPEEFITKEVFTESPELHETVQFEIVDKLSTMAPEMIDTEPQKATTEQAAEEDMETKLPEQEPSQELETEEQQPPITNVPVSPLEETETELPEIVATTQPELASPVFSEGSTISPKIQEEEQEEKQTERPESFTEPTKTMKESDRTGQEDEDNDKKEQESTESVQDELPEATTVSVKASTLIPVSDEDKQGLPEEPLQTSGPEIEHSETTPYLVELEEHTHKMDEDIPTVVPSDESPVAPSQEPTEPTTAASYEEPTAGLSEKPAGPSAEPTVAPAEKYTVSPLEDTTVVSSEEPVVSSSEKPVVSSSEEPAVSTPEEPAVLPAEEPTVVSSEEPTIIPQEESSIGVSEEPTTARSESHETEPQITEAATEKLPSQEQKPELPEVETKQPSDEKEEVSLATEEPHSTASLEEAPEKSTEIVPIEETTSENVKPTNTLLDKFGSSEVEENEKESSTTTPKPEDVMTQGPSIDTEKPASIEETEKDVAVKPQYVPVETTAPEEEFIPVTAKATTAKAEEEAPTQLPTTVPEEKPVELPPSTSAPEISKPDELQPTDEVPSPEEESHFPPSGGYNQEPDYVEEDQAFGPGTCRYGGKVYVSAQQIPRDDPCDFCFCFRSDIICLQQSCPPPIHGCHEEPIQGFCCPRYECPVSMATTLNVTTTTTTTTTTLPPHFLPHAYKGAATRKGCQIKGHTYLVGEVVRASSGPCLHCTCGGDGQMKCDPKQCTPEPMLRQMIAAAVSAKRRR